MAARAGIRSLMKTVAAGADLTPQRSAALLRWAQTSNATPVIAELATRADLDPDTAAAVASNRTAAVRTARMANRDLPVTEFTALLAHESRVSVLTKVAERLCDHDDPGRTEKLSALIEVAPLPVLVTVMVNAPRNVVVAAAAAATGDGDVAFDAVRELGVRVGRNDELRAALTAAVTHTPLMRMCLLHALPGDLGDRLELYWRRLVLDASTDPTRVIADAARLCGHFDDPAAAIEQFRRDGTVAGALFDDDIEDLTAYAVALADAASSDPARIASAVRVALTDADEPRREHLSYLLVKNPDLPAEQLGRLAATRRPTSRRLADLLACAVTGASFEPATAAEVYLQLFSRDDGPGLELLRNSTSPVDAFVTAIAAIDEKARKWKAELLEELYRLDRTAGVTAACQVLVLSDFDGNLPAPGVLGAIADLVTAAIDDDVTAEFAERYAEDFIGSVEMFLDTMAAAFPRSS